LSPGVAALINVMESAKNDTFVIGNLAAYGISLTNEMDRNKDETLTTNKIISQKKKSKKRTKKKHPSSTL